MANKDTSKQWFETGDYPTEAQFAQVFEWLRWKDEEIAMSEVTGLVDTLAALGEIVEPVAADGGDKLYTVPAGYLLTQILWKAGTAATPSCMYEGGDIGDIIPAGDNTKLKDVWTVNVFATSAAINILVQDVPNGGTIYFIKKKIF